MIYPIVAYGSPVLKKKALPINSDYPGLKDLIANMFETMYDSSGVGLAAPQINLSIRLFVIDGEPFSDDEPSLANFKKVFINAEMLEETGEPWAYEEGCLSIPRIRGDVDRPAIIRIRYQNEQFETFEETFSGIDARVIQHEYDHTEGILFLEYLKPVKKAMIRGRLENIRKGKVKVDYKMKFA